MHPDSTSTAKDAARLFKVPVVTQLRPASPSAYVRADSISAVFPTMVGRFGFSDSITLEKPDKLSANEFSEGGYPAYRRWRDTDTLGTDGLELAVDYQKNISRKWVLTYRDSIGFPARITYPVYLFNATPRGKMLYGKDSRVFAIQEAKDRHGYWRPIEREGPDFCGNGSWAMQIGPRQMVVFLLHKYQGSFSTMLRVRFQNNESRYVSAPYPGTIDESQFIATNSEMRRFAKGKYNAEWQYYGATPAALDSIRNQ